MNLKNILAIILCSTTLSFNSGCYIHTFYKDNGRPEIKNLKVGQPYSNNYRIILELDKQSTGKYSFNNKFDANSAISSLSTGTLYIYPEYQIDAKYELKKTMSADYSSGSGEGIGNGIGLLAELIFNTSLVLFFGSRLQDDANNKRDTNYLNLSLFSVGIFNMLYDVTTYKIKEYNLTKETAKANGSFLIYSGNCDKGGLGFTENIVKSNNLDNDKYSPQKNKIPLKDSIIKLGINNDEKAIEIKTDEFGKFIAKKEIINNVISNCLTVNKIKSDMPEAKSVKLTTPYILSTY